MNTISNRWLNAFLFAALVAALYLTFNYKDEDLQEFYHQQAQQHLPTDLQHSISAR